MRYEETEWSASLPVLGGFRQAETVEGRIAAMSNKAGTLQINVKGKGQVVVRTRRQHPV
ncbi:MAG: hypothetical protein U5S82_19495 [Gammaproteobacteria bacterium]|nr:hypothetical protein [Gammaproteobacteria bacterium]